MLIKRLFENKWAPLGFLFLVIVIFYWKVFLKGYIPFPGDMLVGAYFPWLDYKWGYEVGVPVKNPLLSDVFSQFFIWKSLIAESIRNLSWPLWNPYMYSGYPLLANFHSGALNPFNLLMSILGDIEGWKVMVLAQSFGSVFAMYFYLKNLRLSNISCVLGSIVYGFNTFSVTWLEFVTLGFAMIWIPLILLTIDKYFEKYKAIYLLFTVPLNFLLMSSGHFQALILSFILFNTYFLFRLFCEKNIGRLRALFIFVFAEVLSVGFMAVQLLPTYFHLNSSIRFDEQYIKYYNFGLLPIKNFVTILSPNFFGNPATGNYRGFFNYHETTFYMGIAGLFGLVYGVSNFRKLPLTGKYFLTLSLFSLMLIFDNPLSQHIYRAQIPLLSTSAAGRNAFLYIFGVTVLTSYWFETLSKISFPEHLKKFWLIYVLTFFLFVFLLTEKNLGNLGISFRNFIPTLFLVFGFLSCFFLFGKKDILLYLLVLLTIADLFFLADKYLPYVKKEFVYPKTDVLNYLLSQKGNFRVEAERGPLFPANTWSYYRLSSTSGYDPLALKDYVGYYQKEISKNEDSFLSRYSTLIKTYDAQALGDLSVKYLLGLKYTDIDEIRPTGNRYFYNINQKDWKKVYEYGTVVVFENTKYKERVRLEDFEGKITGNAKVLEYKPNEISISYNTPKDSVLVVMDAWESGWRAKLNSSDAPIDKYKEVFRSVAVPKGEGNVRLFYDPQSFKFGLIISGISFVIWLTTVVCFWLKNIHYPRTG